MSNVYANLKPKQHQESRYVAQAPKPASNAQSQIDSQVNELRNIFPNVGLDNLRLFVMQHPSESQLEQAVAKTIEEDTNLNKINEEWTKKKTRGGARKQRQRQWQKREHTEEQNADKPPEALPIQPPDVEEHKVAPADTSSSHVVEETELSTPRSQRMPRERRGRGDRRARGQPRRQHYEHTNHPPAQETSKTGPAKPVQRSIETQTIQQTFQETGVQTEEIYTPHVEYSRRGPRARRRDRRGRYTYQ